MQAQPNSQPRCRRWRNRLIVLAGLSVGLVLLLPWLVCNTPMADGMIQAMAGKYGWRAKAIRIRCGWLTPVHLEKLTLVGPSGETKLSIGQISTDATLLDLVGGKEDWGTVQLRGVSGALVLHEGTSSLENDLLQALADENETTETSEAKR